MHPEFSRLEPVLKFGLGPIPSLLLSREPVRIVPGSGQVIFLWISSQAERHGISGGAGTLNQRGLDVVIKLLINLMNSAEITVHIVENLHSQGGYGPLWPQRSSASGCSETRT